jgi:HTH-type transcriptional regulator/antitoxin HigA
MGALVIDNKKYARVLAKVLPRVITTDKEYERMLAEVEKLMDKGKHRSAEEDTALDLMVRLIEDYEEEHDLLYPIRVPTKCWFI